MVYAYDNWALLPVKDLYDTTTMQMAIAAAKDMYDKGQKQMEDFYEKYGDFMSPFAKDMERYGDMVSKIQEGVDFLYLNGIDPLRSSEGRTLVNRLTHSINPREYNAMRANAKVGYAYLDAMLKLRSLGKYSDAQELFDIMTNGGTNFSEFSTIDPKTRTIRSWDRSSPIEATSLLDLTYDHYKGRTARDLTKEDLDAAGIPYDSRYRYSGYLDSDLMKVAPGASLALAGDPRAAFFRDLARQKVIARGETPTAEAVETQFQRDIADANKWALIDPTKQADEFALDDHRTANDIYAHRVNAQVDYENDLKKEHDWDNNGEVTPDEIMFSNMYGTKTGKKAKAGAIRDAVNSGLFQYGDAQQDQATMKMVDALIGQLTEKDPVTGKDKKVTVQNANRETVELAYSNALIPYRQFMRKLWNKHRLYNHTGDANDGVFGNKAFKEYLNKFGSIDADLGFKASTGENSNSSKSKPFSAADISNIYTDAELLAMAEGYKGFAEGYTHEDELKRVLRNRAGGSLSRDAWNQFVGENASGVMEGMRGSSQNQNVVPVILPNGSRIIFRAVNIKYGTNKSYHNTGRLWIQVGSPTMPGIYRNTKTGRRMVAILPYTDQSQSLGLTELNGIYTQLLGGQQHQNVSLEQDTSE